MSGGICFRNIRGGVLKIGEDALLQMRSYVQDDRRKPEAGGILLGRFVIGTADVVIDQVTVPMPGDWLGVHVDGGRATFDHAQLVAHLGTALGRDRIELVGEGRFTQVAEIALG